MAATSVTAAAATTASETAAAATIHEVTIMVSTVAVPAMISAATVAAARIAVASGILRGHAPSHASLRGRPSHSHSAAQSRTIRSPVRAAEVVPAIAAATPQEELSFLEQRPVTQYVDAGAEPRRRGARFDRGRAGRRGRIVMATIRNALEGKSAAGIWTRYRRLRHMSGPKK